MNDLPRRTISELITRYELEPSVGDIYVEGSFDREVISRVLKTQNSWRQVVYEIDTVEVSDRLLASHGFSTGKKQRVIALSKELEAISDQFNILCIVDCDLDHWFTELQERCYLRWTEYCDIESYFIESDLVYDILIEITKCRIDNWTTFYDSFIETLWTLYCLRLTDLELNLNMRWLPIHRCLHISADCVEFDLVEYIRRLLATNRVTGRREEFELSVEAWRAKKPREPRLGIRGHDFVNSSALIVKKTGGVRSFGNIEAIQRLLVFCAERRKELIRLIE